MELPMLEPHEFEVARRLYAAALESPGDLEARFDALRAEYLRVTGFEESNHNAIMHHAVELYGPPCLSCDKPLRTPEARQCAACGVTRSGFKLHFGTPTRGWLDLRLQSGKDEVSLDVSYVADVVNGSLIALLGVLEGAPIAATGICTEPEWYELRFSRVEQQRLRVELLEITRSPIAGTVRELRFEHESPPVEIASALAHALRQFRATARPEHWHDSVPARELGMLEARITRMLGDVANPFGG